MCKRHRFVTYIVSVDEPGHFCGWLELAVYVTFEFASTPPVVDVCDCHHVPLEYTELRLALGKIQEINYGFSGIPAK